MPFLAEGVVVRTFAWIDILGREGLDASASLGADAFYTFRRVTLPMIRPGILAGAFIAFMATLDNVSVSLFLSGPETDVLPIHMWSMLESTPSGAQRPGSAAAVVEGPAPRCARRERFSLHANVALPAKAREQLEHLCGTCFATPGPGAINRGSPGAAPLRAPPRSVATQCSSSLCR